ncbi:hypothetical protein EB061_12055 [bacterium]|jgi:hypothetical protein|nr:hypothetical protein [bacterium]
MREEEKNKNAVTSHVHGTRADRMPDPGEAKGGETEDRVKDAFLGRPLVIPEARGDLADRAQADQDAEIDEQLDRIRRRARK